MKYRLGYLNFAKPKSQKQKLGGLFEDFFRNRAFYIETYPLPCKRKMIHMPESSSQWEIVKTLLKHIFLQKEVYSWLEWILQTRGPGEI